MTTKSHKEIFKFVDSINYTTDNSYFISMDHIVDPFSEEFEPISFWLRLDRNSTPGTAVFNWIGSNKEVEIFSPCIEGIYYRSTKLRLVYKKYTNN